MIDEFSNCKKCDATVDSGSTPQAPQGTPPRMIPFIIKKNEYKWTCKNVDNGKVYYLKISSIKQEHDLTKFLAEIGVTIVNGNDTPKPLDYYELSKSMLLTGNHEILVPEDKVDAIADKWNLDESKIMEFNQITINEYYIELLKQNTEELKKFNTHIEKHFNR